MADEYKEYRKYETDVVPKIPVEDLPLMLSYNVPVEVVPPTEEKKKPEWPDSERQRKSRAELERQLEIEKALNAIFPARTWEADGKLWQQTVSSIPPTRQDIHNLQQLLNIRLEQTGAEEKGLCEKRNALYSQCLDEVIRIVTINLPERGVLLARIRDDLNISLRSWVTLYYNSLPYGFQKAAASLEERISLRKQVAIVKKDADASKERYLELKAKFEAAERRRVEIREARQIKFDEKLDVLKRANAQLRSQLEAISTIKRK